MDTWLKPQLLLRAHRLRVLAATVGDAKARAYIEQTAREIEAFDEETARLFLSSEQPQARGDD